MENKVMTPNSLAQDSDFSQEEQRGLYRAIYSRRDIRSFKNEPIPPNVLARLVNAAHHGPSVGFMQPWDFVMIRDYAIRQKVKDLFIREREAASCFFDEPRRSQYLSLKLEGILESAVNICVTCDPPRADVVLGRNSIQVAYLCLGYPIEFPADPILQTAGWRERIELNELMHFDGWDKTSARTSWKDFENALTENLNQPFDSPQH